MHTVPARSTSAVIGVIRLVSRCSFFKALGMSQPTGAEKDYVANTIHGPLTWPDYKQVKPSTYFKAIESCAPFKKKKKKKGGGGGGGRGGGGVQKK